MKGPIARNLRYIFNKNGMSPIYLLLGATYRCNSRCLTCFNSDMLNKNPGAELTLDEHRKIAKTMGPITWLLFTGGEPLLREDLAEIATVYYKTNNVLRITIPTNALLPEKAVSVAEQILHDCPDVGLAFSLSMDDVGDRHDAIRGVRGNFGAMLETYDRLVKMKSGEPRLSINLNTVLMNRNIGNLYDMMSFVKERMPGADFHGFEVLRGRSPAPDIAPPTPEQYEAALAKFIPYWSSFPFYRGPMRRVLKAMKIETRKLELEALRGKLDMPCHAGRISCVIDPIGDVYPCEELVEKIGNLREVGLDFGKLWNSPRAEELRRFIGDKKCRCVHSCFIGSSMMFEPSGYPALLKRILFPND